MGRKMKGALLTAGGGMCWGLSGSMGQYLFSVEGMDSRWLVPIRLFLAGVVLFIFGLVRYGKSVFEPFSDKKDTLLVLAYGIPGVACSQFFYFLCIQLSTAGVGTILQDLAPVPILVVGCIRMRRKPRGYEMLSIVLALLGVFCLVTHGDPADMTVSAGALLAGICSALCITIYNEVGASLVKKYPVAILQTWSFLFGGALIAVIFRAWTIRYVPTAMGILGIAFVVLVGNVLAFTLYMNGVSLIGPETGILYGFMEPVTAAIVTALFLGSPFTLWDALGFVLVFLMMVLISMGEGLTERLCGKGRAKA